MPSLTTKPASHVERKRRVHAKSRKGCGNCKIRRVKCDELRPRCKKCLLYGVECSYGGGGNALRIPTQGCFQVEFVSGTVEERVVEFGAVDPGQTVISGDDEAATQPDAMKLLTHPFSNRGECSEESFDTQFLLTPFSFVSMNSTMATMIDNSLQLNLKATDMQPCPESRWGSVLSSWHFSEAHLEVLSRFRERTSLTIGMKELAAEYRDLLCSLAITHPFLMHMLLSLTLMHDADLSVLDTPSLAIQQKHTSLQHWNTASKLFNTLLAKPIAPARRDAVWATGVVIGAASFWYINSSHVEQVWPLKPYEPSDLAWLRLGEGKRALWRVSDPSRPDSVFHHLMKRNFSHCHSVPEWIDIHGSAIDCPAHIKRIFNIGVTSTIDNNVYHLPLLILSRIQNMRLTHENVLSFLYVTAFITPKLLDLLDRKDARAVFLIGWWFQLIVDGELWWMTSRARIEGRAVRIWLEREDRVFGLAGVLDELLREGGRAEGDGMGLPINIWKHQWAGERVAA